MKEILLAPFKAIYNLDIYIKAIKQSVWRTLLFLVYLFVLSSVLFFAGIALKTPSLTPFLQDLTEQIAQMTPDIEVKNGIINANNGEYYEISPEGFDKKIVFDTERTEPIYPTQMMNENIAILVTAQTIYIFQQDQMQTYNLKEDINFTINKNFIIDNQSSIIRQMKTFIFWIAVFVIPIIVLLLMFILMILAIVATAISQLFIKADISFGEVCSICCYLLAPALFLLFLITISPFMIPFTWLICFVLFMVYSQFILNKIKGQQVKADCDQEAK